jgi:hypothetical protein
MAVPKDKVAGEHSSMKLSPWCLALFLFDAAAFLYLQLFIFPCKPIFLPNDSLIWLQDARAMVDGKILYLDLFQITFPGIQVILAAVIKALGPRVWLPNAILVLLGTFTAWLTTVISKRVISGQSALLPAFLLLSFEFSAWHVVSHHWFSTLAAMAAILVALEKRSAGRIGVVGALCGLAAWFTQTEGALVLLAFAVFVLWECQRMGKAWRPVILKLVYLFAGFILVLGLGVGYFVWKAGPREFIYSTFIFPVKYAPAWVEVNTYRVYLGSLLGLRAWEVVPLLFVYAAIPWVYLYFFLAYMRQRDGAPSEAWDRLMLVNIAGFSLFVSVAPAPAWIRLCTVSPPAWIVLIWLLRNSTRRISRAVVNFLWIAGVLCAATILLKTFRHEQLLRADLNLPAGQTAFLDTGAYDEFKYLAARTSPSDYFFGGRNVHFYFPLGLRPPSRISYVIPNDWTRPGEVSDLIAGLERHRARYVLWQLMLDNVPEHTAGGENLVPLRAYLHEHYHVTKIFSGSNDQLWERNE